MNPRTTLRHPATLAAAVALVILGAATTTPWHVRVPASLFDGGGAPLPETEPASVPPPPNPEQTPPATDNDTVLTVLLALGVLVIALLLWRAARAVLTALRDAPEAPPDPDHLDVGDTLPGSDAPVVPLPELADAVTRALAHLDAATTPTDAVVAAWIALEDAAAEHGTHRHPSQTPTEFTQAVLDHTPAPADHVATLRRLYARARFTDRPTDPEDITTARHALTAIARALDTPTDPTPPTNHDQANP